jgi:dolichyl-diphosphooligosaccharide--protein glycosyltransferase
LILNKSLFQIGSNNFQLKHLLVIGILILSFSLSLFLRSTTTQYGFELNEFDPFYNFRATEYIIENGYSQYFEWHDDKTWYPWGRDVSATSQSMLHLTAAITYQLFGGNSNLYDFTIIFPAIIGSLTVIVIFALVRLFAGTTAGLFASLLFSISLPILLRGTFGWFKSEPLGIFYGVLGLYLFLSGIRSKNKKIAFSKIILGGMVLTFGMASWGGNQFFIIPLGLFILALPFVRKDHKFLLSSIPVFVGTFLLTAIMFERPGPNFVFGIGGLSIIIPTIFLVACIFIQKISSDKNKIRNGLILLISVIIIGSSLFVISNESDSAVTLPSFRYLNALNPFLTTIDPLTDSVAEHATTNVKESFLFHTTILIFSGLGVWLVLSKKISKNEIFTKNDMRLFVIIIGITGVYVSSAFVRLEVFASISLVILASIALSILTKQIFSITLSQTKNYLLKTSYVGFIAILFMLPLVFPDNQSTLAFVDMPPAILSGGTPLLGTSANNDWLDTLEWIKLNTPENAVIASWWDYGYWITVMSERATLIDNATLIDSRITQVAQIFLSEPNDAWKSFNEMNVDYVVIFISGEKYMTPDNKLFFDLRGGGDESKITWFARIAEKHPSVYQHNDYKSPTNYFWNETLLGKLFPFTVLTYYNPQTQEESPIFRDNFHQLTIKNIKYSFDSSTPFNLVYASSTFVEEKSGPMTGVFVYKINKNYTPLD